MKKTFIPVLLVLSAMAGYPQARKYDSLAIIIIDRMSDVIGDLESCSFKLFAAHDVVNGSSGSVKYFSDYEVFFKGPDKALINAHGYRGHRELLYNGEQLAYYSFNENNYGIMPAPDNIIRMIDSLHDVYDIEFPAADFFYPAFTDDLIQASDSIRYLGMEEIANKEYFHVIAYSRDMDAQFWINNDSYNLPARFSITYKTKPGMPQYLALFSDWQINPQLPDAMFDFQPPPDATPVRMMARKNK